MTTEHRPSRRELDPGELAARLATLVRERLEATIDDLEPLEGGRSSLTYRATLTRNGGSGESIVVKIAPPGLEPVANRDVLRQARVLEVLARDGRVPVPSVLLTEAGAPPATPPLFLMNLVDGATVEPIFSASGTLPGADVVRGRAFAAARGLAALHAVPVHGFGAGEPVVTIVDELVRWDRTMQAAGGSEESDLIRERLLATVPADIAPTLVHGDFRLGNCLFVDATLTAVLDWEIWAVSDPRIDLAWLMLTAMPDTHPGADRAPEGMPSPEEVVEHYRVHTDRPGATENMDWFLASALFKMAAMTRHIGKKFPADDPRRTGREAGAARMLAAASALL
ncbi:phosphotransferase family protein [Rhodococcus sp. T2V]|uniref:phosphotransferase family protein n=1 Tax=Rhodococcus sp. T2V TaxID=3034164 RepID=UPI0023E1298C|nr:phosphotransferase family protein [Rhodococcus sp. T2V]MDF3310057.1 phosphotransferase family protein [Rhodococcus sp. T2V]